MTDLGVLQQTGAGRSAHAVGTRRLRPWRVGAHVLVVLVLAAAALLVLMTSVATGPRVRPARLIAARPTPPPVPPGYAQLPAATQINAKFKLPITSGLLFDVRTGRVLWRRAALRVVPMASLTKMMTALIIVSHTRPSARVRITRAAVDYSGSGVGNLPFGKKISLMTLLYGLMLPSGNDAAIALAQHVARTEPRFVAMMNARAREMHLRCTHFDTVSGIVDRGNHSCAVDLAIMAHEVLKQPLLAKIVATRNIVMPMPVKGGKVYLFNNNPLLELHYRGADGVKTGYTQAAGRCLVASARRGHKWLGVVLLHSDDPPDQAQQLLNAGFRAPGV
jgi:serine-type D-Ala-D-Ala carboxypeptidase (penicillin-binding protein 5/6)